MRRPVRLTTLSRTSVLAMGMKKNSEGINIKAKIIGNYVYQKMG